MIEQAGVWQGVSRPAVVDRRETARLHGPFDGWRLGELDTPVRIYDIGAGGCFVHSMHEERPGIVLTLRIDMPSGVTVQVRAETIYSRPGFGFAVRFLDLDGATLACIEHAVEGERRPSVRPS